MSVSISSSFDAKLDPKKVGVAMDKATHEVAYQLYSKCVENSPYRTGKLQESHSIWGSTDTNALKTDAAIKNSAKYWSYVEFGTSKMDARRWVYKSLTQVDSFAVFSKSFRAWYKPGGK